MGNKLSLSVQPIQLAGRMVRRNGNPRLPDGHPWGQPNLSPGMSVTRHRISFIGHLAQRPSRAPPHDYGGICHAIRGWVKGQRQRSHAPSRCGSRFTVYMGVSSLWGIVQSRSGFRNGFQIEQLVDLEGVPVGNLPHGLGQLAHEGNHDFVLDRPRAVGFEFVPALHDRMVGKQP